ncbi:hypothetical protein SPHINGO8BC_280001 [Sphingobacterium multivorum]|uniref:Uncharacterized protein n=1 Tax=Sphingobacterium multivorum TaxID=28454 RepID=A0A654BCY9_SPHMU|nr:hypothetical protein SPHINGO8BC_280001 [Sphingobacterium multivorum]
MLDTDTSRDGQAAEADEEQVEDEGEQDDADRPDHDGGQGVGAAEAGQPGEDEAAESGAERVGGDGGDAHHHLCGDADAAQDDRPRHRQFDLQQGAEPAHADAARRLDDGGRDLGETDDRVAQDRQCGEEDDRDDRRQDAEAERDDEQADDGERRQGEADGRHPVRERGQARAAVDECGEHHGDDRGEDDALDDQ